MQVLLIFRSLSWDHVHNIDRDRERKERDQERGRNISKTCVFIFHHSIQYDEASGYTFYNTLKQDVKSV